MSVPLAIADTVAKGCNATCGRAITSLIRLIIQVSWHYFHWWTLVIISPFLALAGWLRFRE